MLGYNPATDMATQQLHNQIMINNQMMIDNHNRVVQQQLNDQVMMQPPLQHDTFSRSSCILPPKNWKPDPFAGLGKELTPEEKLKKKWEDLRKPKYVTETPAQATEQTQEVESFGKVFKEFTENVPDVTTTVEEKTLALGYIERIKNSDATDNLKEYWTQKSDTIQQEIKNIYKTEKNLPKTEKVAETSETQPMEKKTFKQNVVDFFSKWGNKLRAMQKYCLCRIEK